MTETRRRGAVLESAVLEAAWDELVDRGYAGMTYESIAERSQTGKQVLYRRWPTKRHLLLALLEHQGIMTPAPVIPDTGTLRNDVVELLQRANRLAHSIPGLFSTLLGAYFDETETSPAQLRAMVFDGRPSGMERVVARAAERGEIVTAAVPNRLIAMPFDLFRHELMMTLAPVPDVVIEDIVDTLFMPLISPVNPAAHR